MRILFQHDFPSAPYYYRRAIADALEFCGHKCVHWWPEQKPAFDIFTEQKFDIFIGQTYNLSNAIIKNINKNPEMKVVLYASAYGDALKDVPAEYPIVRASDEERGRVAQIKPSAFFLHHHPNRIKYSIGGWEEEFGAPAIGLCKAANVIEYWGGLKVRAFECDAYMCGGYWGYKAKTLNPYVLPLCTEQKINIKIFGNTSWPVPQFLGNIHEGNMRHLFKSGLIGLNVHEKHSQDFGYDIIERPFKTALTGFCISDYVESLAKDCFTNNEIPFAKTPQEFKELVYHFASKPDERIPYMERGQKTILENHTYFHRAKLLMETLGYENESKQIEEKYGEWRRINTGGIGQSPNCSQ